MFEVCSYSVESVLAAGSVEYSTSSAAYADYSASFSAAIAPIYFLQLPLGFPPEDGLPLDTLGPLPPLPPA